MSSTRTIAILLTALTLTACGASPGNGVNPQDIQSVIESRTQCPFAYYYGPIWSEDGSDIYYSFALSPYSPNNPPELRSINVDGTANTILTTGAVVESLSPDGSLILFSNGDDYYLYDIVNNNTRLLVKNAVGADWSPDGQWIVYTDPMNHKWHMYKVNVETGEIVQLSKGKASYTQVLWSPDGSEIAFDATSEDIRSIYLMNQNGSDVRRLTDASAEQCNSDFKGHALLDWTPHGDTLAFQRYCGEDFAVGFVTTDGVDLGNWGPDDGLKRLWPVVWSPDGKSVLYRTVDSNGPSLNIADSDGSNGHVLMAGGVAGVWSPDSQQIVVAVREFISSTKTEIYHFDAINADGTGAHRVVNNPGNQHTCWH